MTESFRSYVHAQTNAARHFQQTNLVMISVFGRGGDRSALEYFVQESGWEYDQRYVYDWAHQSSRSKQLSPSELARLRTALRELPVESDAPPIEWLTIVSFRDATNWVTRSYDTRKLPVGVRHIYDVVGERYESKQRSTDK